MVLEKKYNHGGTDVRERGGVEGEGDIAAKMAVVQSIVRLDIAQDV